jgi:SAM-dependent methyltransferase
MENKIVNTNISYDIDWSFIIICELLSKYDFHSILDVGSGSGSHSSIFKAACKNVTSIDKYNKSDFNDDVINFKSDTKFDVIFCSHVIEHQRNIGLFLDCIYDLLKEDGILVITGPTHNPQKLIEGHLTTCHLPFLIQNLILAGFSVKGNPIYSIINYESGIIVKKNAEFDLATRVGSGFNFLYKNHWPEIPEQGSMIYNGRLFARNISTPIEIRSPDINRPLATKNLNLKVKGRNYFVPFEITSRRFSDVKVIFTSL